MPTRAEHSAGVMASGEMNGKRFAEHIGVAHGTVKRWLHEGMPCKRTSRQVWIDPKVAKPWLEERFGDTIAFHREAVVYFARRDNDGAIKIGWTSDVVRRVHELRRDVRADVQLLACFPGDKPDELRMHARFAADRIEGEWYRPSTEIVAFVDGIRRAAA